MLPSSTGPPPPPHPNALPPSLPYPCPTPPPPTRSFQGVVLLFGSITFLIIQKTELGGLPAAFDFWSDLASKSRNILAMQTVPTKQTIVNYFDFVLKVRALGLKDGWWGDRGGRK